MFDAGLIKSALIVMPVSLLTNWEKEFNKWYTINNIPCLSLVYPMVVANRFSEVSNICRAPGIRVKLFHGSNKTEREKNLRKVQKKHGVCLTTYGRLSKCQFILRLAALYSKAV